MVIKYFIKAISNQNGNYERRESDVKERKINKGQKYLKKKNNFKTLKNLKKKIISLTCCVFLLF